MSLFRRQSTVAPPPPDITTARVVDRLESVADRMEAIALEIEEAIKRRENHVGQ